MRPRLAFGACSIAAAIVVHGVSACVGDDPSPGQGQTTDGGPPPGSESGPPPNAPVDAGDGGDAASCAAPLADCTGSGTCDTSTATEPKHCGACGHDCGGGSCVGGRCQPQTLAPNVDAPLSVGINSTGVFWIRAAAVEKCPKAGCAGSPTLLATSTVQASMIARRLVYVDETKMYWLGAPPGTPTHVFAYACEVGGCGMTPTPLDSYTGPAQIVGNATSLVWYDATGGLKLLPLAGGATTYLSLVYKDSSFGFAVHGSTLVFSNTDPTAGGAAGVWLGTVANTVPIKLMDKGLHVAVTSTTVFASVDLNATQSTVTSCPLGGCGGTGTALFATHEGPINDVVADGAAVYWAVKASAGAADGTIRKCALPSCPGGPQTVADNQANPVALALDADFLYWANGGTGATNTGAIVRVRR